MKRGPAIFKVGRTASRVWREQCPAYLFGCWLVLWGPLAWLHPAEAADSAAVALPPRVSAVWDLDKAWRQTTATRERICLNGLWRWQPADAAASVPAENWGYFKTPGPWPGITDYMQKDCQTVIPHPAWQSQRLGALTAAWYQREFCTPDRWAGRRIWLNVHTLNSYAVVWVDHQRVGELRFPGGELELTAACRPGSRQLLSLQVLALPLKGVLLSYADTAAARQFKGTVARRGLCGDVFLVGAARGPRLRDAKVDTSVRRGQAVFSAALEGLEAGERYQLVAQVSGAGQFRREFRSPIFTVGDLREGRLAFSVNWLPEQRWDLPTPHHQFRLDLALLDAAGKTLDAAWPETFGFREFWIEGRDFYLNGTRLQLAAVPLDNAQVGAAWASYAGAKESLERLKSIGINFVYTHNYDCLPGSHLDFAEILRAADDVGMLVALTQPHFSHYEWPNADADRTNGYAGLAEAYVRVAQNHPSVVMYAMSHNATGYSEDMNPDMIDGKQEARDAWAKRNVQRALRAEAIVKRLDPERIIYHHASGNLGPMHAVNFYPNFVPIQEMSDWFEHWATQGIKPVFLCEYGAPFTWDWTMYRGWYKGKREFGSAVVPWEFCLAEWNAQFYGDRAYQISEQEKRNLRWEARQFQADKGWHRWDYPHPVGSRDFDEHYPILAQYLTDNWRAFRTWGVSAISPWEHGHYWKLRPGVDKSRQELRTDWENLQRPGFSADYLEQRYERMDLAFERSDWVATPAAQALLRNNRPRLAYLAGGPGRFTSKEHNFLPGETVAKQIIVINNSRQTATVACEWVLALPRPQKGARKITLATGQQERIPLRGQLPSDLAPGRYELHLTAQFGDGETQSDTLTLHVMPTPAAATLRGKVAVFDPPGETTAWLRRMGIAFQTIEPETDLAAFDLLILGKGALSLHGPAPDLRRVREGLKVLVFEQTSEVLEQRLGFRLAEYGLRQVFARIPDHPLLAGLTDELLRDWRGEATLLPPRLKYELNPKFNGAPTVQWCGMPVTRLWRCGNRGNVASVLIEKPALGDFLPVLDGGYGLQYSPLLEYREGAGVILFCQVDVTGRTAPEPAAETLKQNLLRYLAAWRPSPRRTLVYVGHPEGRAYLEAMGYKPAELGDGRLSRETQVLVIGPGGGRSIMARPSATDFIREGGQVLALGLEPADAAAMKWLNLELRMGEHIAAYFQPFGWRELLAGVSPAEVHNRDPRELPLVAGGAVIYGNGVLARMDKANVVCCQLAPWQFDGTKQTNLKRTRRRLDCLVSRLLGNLGAAAATPLLERFHQPPGAGPNQRRWLVGLYADQPEEWDDPYRFFRW
ncbi:glycoside hydrolase family 2 TIM barrel-domain containing protein [Fontisphaera persica]|uniref:glycoside hydrolase family 2 TIM barrel-domain containing protein n=1 Tax=Fontisphaera persica TaxID=2974023 RepID=UPI0024C0A16A|nr:glycoside hydrolase family 2 TIM barrel-domain containing protein [Fontisphaera persica]WCJ58150.1 glycoside hydrolase family 2 TIM barrel-domain containing protein [Fontisphaera persica]